MPLRTQDNWVACHRQGVADRKGSSSALVNHGVGVFAVEGERSLHFLTAFEAFGAFIHFRISMSTAKITGAFAARHKAHTDPTPFSADKTVLFSFGFWHLDSPSSRSCVVISINLRHKAMHGRRLYWPKDCGVMFPLGDLDTNNGTPRKSGRLSSLKRRQALR